MATCYTERQAKVTLMGAASTFYQWRKDGGEGERDCLSVTPDDRQFEVLARQKVLLWSVECPPTPTLICVNCISRFIDDL